MMGNKRPTSSTTAVDMSDEITRLRAQLTAAEAELTEIKQDRPYVMGWNAGFEHAQAAAEDENKELVLELLAAQGQAADAINDKLAAMERVREAAAKACVCTIAERRIDNSLEHERRIEARIRALDVSDIAKGVK